MPNRWKGRCLTCFASITVPTPTVRAMVGTFERSPSKNRAFAWMVSIARVFTLVLEARLEPGSLKAMWPSGPIPATKWRRRVIFIGEWWDFNNVELVVYGYTCLLTSNEEFDSPSISYLLLEALALRLQICSVAIQNVDIFCSYVNVLEEVIPHEGMVALLVISRETLAIPEKFKLKSSQKEICVINH